MKIFYAKSSDNIDDYNNPANIAMFLYDGAYRKRIRIIIARLSDLCKRTFADK